MKSWKIILFFVLFFIICRFLLDFSLDDSKFDDSSNVSVDSFEVDPIVSAAKPYIDPIVFDDIILRSKASFVVRSCSSNDKECYVNEIYRYLVEDYHYFSDPRNGELIQDPYDTISVMGGDCEDLTILLNSLMENLGIKTYVILSENHAYSLACDVNVSRLMDYAETSLIEQISKDFNLHLDENDGKYYFEDGKLYYISKYSKVEEIESQKVLYVGGDGSLFDDPVISLSIDYSMSSSQPVTMFVVSSNDDYEAFVEGEDIFPICDSGRIAEISDECGPMYEKGGVMIYNNDDDTAVVQLDIEYKYLVSSIYFLDYLMENGVANYLVENQTCVVLDATVGKYGYPGYDGNLTGTKIAIDPLTYDYFIIYDGFESQGDYKNFF